MKGIKQIGISNMRYPAGVGYVIIPQDADRAEFVARCYRTNTLVIYTENTELIFDVAIHPTLLQWIEFPVDGENLGSMITWVNVAVHNKPIIVGILPKNDDATGMMEYFFQMKKETDEAMAAITGRGDQGSLDVVVRGNSSVQGRMNFRVINDQAVGELNIDVDGDINILADESITLDAGNRLELIISDAEQNNRTIISYERENGLSYVDEFENEWIINNEGVRFNSNLVQVGDGTDFAVLYQKLVDELRKVEAKADTALLAIQQGQTAAQDGGAAYKSSMTAIISAANNQNVDYGAFKSEKVKLD